MATAYSNGMSANEARNIDLQQEIDCTPLNLCKSPVVNEASSSGTIPIDGEGVHVKETLKQLIQNRRMAEGKDALTVSFQDENSNSSMHEVSIL